MIEYSEHKRRTLGVFFELSILGGWRKPLQQSTHQRCALLLSLLLEFWQQLTMLSSKKALVIVVTNKSARNLFVPFPVHKGTVALTYSVLGADVNSRTVRIDTARAFALQITDRCLAHVQGLECRSCTNSSTVENNGSNDNSSSSHRG
jgi:hypothetical protein